MKKNYIGTAVIAILATACANDEIVERSMDNGQLFEITADHGMASRTVLSSDESKTFWQAGDKIFVTSLDGDVTGELTLKKGAGSERATFAGKVNGDPAKLAYAVYPAPVDGVINMGELADGELDAPMFGSLDDDKNVAFENECALVKVQIYGAAGMDVNVKIDGLAGGQYALDYEDYSVSLNYTKSQDGMTITSISEDGVFYVPVYAGTNFVALDAAAARATSTTKEMIITIGDQTIKQNVTIEKGKIDKDNADIEYKEGKYFNEIVKIDYGQGAELKAALEAGKSVKLIDNVSLASNEVVIKHGGEANLYLNGHTLFLDRSMYLFDGTLNVADGKIRPTGQGYTAIWLSGKYTDEEAAEEGAEAVLNIEEDVIFENIGHGIGIRNYYNSGTSAVVNFAGSITATGFAIFTNGSMLCDGTINVTENAKVTSTGATAIYLPKGECNIAGGEIEGYEAAVEIRGGNLNVTGGKLRATYKPADGEQNTNGSTIRGAAVAVSQHTTDLPIDVKISDGEIKGSYAIYEEDFQNNSNGKDFYTELISIEVTGGVFTCNGNSEGWAPVKSENVEGFIKGGYFNSSFDNKYVNEQYQLVKETTGDYKNWYTVSLKVAEE